MKYFIALILFVCSAGIVDRLFAQGPEQDVIVMKDRTILRGTILQTVTPGSPVVIQKTTGKTSSILWSEVLAIRKLPVSLSDSAITALYFGGEGKPAPSISMQEAPRGDMAMQRGSTAGDTTSEDVLVLNNGRIMRGRLIESGRKETVGIVTAGGDLTVAQKSDVKKTLHLEKGLSDSTIDVFYVHPLPEMIADDFRVLTIFGGFSMVGSDLSAPTADGAGTVSSGYAFGLHASLRVFPTVRWATTGIYGSHPMSWPEQVGPWAPNGPGPMKLIWVLTGMEVRSEGTNALKGFGFIQGGILVCKLDGVNFTFPQTFYHLSGSGSLAALSSNSFAFCLGGGISMGRFSLSARWLASTASFRRDFTLQFEYSNPIVTPYNYDQHVTLILIALGFTII